MLAQRRRRWPSITSELANVSCYLRSRFSGDGGEKRHPHSNATVPTNTGQSPNVVSMLSQRQRLWVNIESALGECHVFSNAAAKYNAETAMGCDTGLTLNRNWVGRPTSSVRAAIIEWMLVSTGDGGGRNTIEDMF